MTIRVGILRGGLSGENILSNLPQKYSGHDILLTKRGEWIFNSQFSYPEKIFRQIDVVFNTLHGCQKILEHFNVPYIGSGFFASSLGMNKILSRDIFSKAGLNVPKGVVINVGENLFTAAKNVLNSISPPWVVKSNIVFNFPDLISVLEKEFGFDNKIIVEEYIRGKDAVCGVIENFRGQDHYSLPVTEIISSRQICPARFDRETKDKIEEMAKIAHQILGCRHYSRQDFRISERAEDKGKIYILEANALMPKNTEAIGLSYPQFLDHLINLALKC